MGASPYPILPTRSVIFRCRSGLPLAGTVQECFLRDDRFGHRAQCRLWIGEAAPRTRARFVIDSASWTMPTSRVGSLAERLPFRLSDTEAANEVFQQWLDGDEQRKRDLDLWTYCYIWKYFLVKKAQKSITEAAAIDDLIARAYQKVEQNRTEIQNPSRYASWVSVVCKNTFLNHARKDRVTESIHDEDGPELVAEPSGVEPDTLSQPLLQAIDRLPPYLQQTARLYFLERRTFPEIAEVVGKSVATVRTYKHKAIQRLRDDEALREHLHASSS